MGRIDSNLHQRIYERRQHFFDRYVGLKELYLQDNTVYVHIETALASDASEEDMIALLIKVLVKEKKHYFNEVIRLTGLRAPDPLFKKGPN